MTDLVFKLENFGCPNCGAKIEKEVSCLEGVTSASLDFITKKLVVVTKMDIDRDRITIQIYDIIEKIEPGTKVDLINGKSYQNSNSFFQQEGDRKRQHIRLMIGAAFFAIGILMKLPDHLELAVFFISYIAAGGTVIYRAVKSAFKGQLFNENFLMSLATAGAFFVGEYPEGAGVMLFYLVGEMMQDRAVDYSRRSIADLMDIRPDYANIYKEGKIINVSPEDVRIGDVIIINPGEKIPLDGRVLTGTSMADTSALTGESMPRELGPGTAALSGFININGVLKVEVTKDYGESTVSKILDLVENAAARKAPTENFITKFARYYTPVVVLGALMIAAIPPLIIPGALFSDWLYRALIFLVISCPCALVISIPLGFFGGIGGASRRGILIKGGNYLEALNHVETVVFDKTGTLTEGVFRVTQINCRPFLDQHKLMEYAAMAESHSKHPIALSILKYYKECYGEEPDHIKIQHYSEVPGRGITLKTDEVEILAGNFLFMKENNILPTDEEVNPEAMIGDLESVGTRVHIAVDKIYAGNIWISDEIKEDAEKALQKLKALGVKKTVMLTGDVKASGEKIGTQLGLDEIYAELLPAEKVEKVELLERNKSEKGVLIFIGDGINDAPSLARSDVGIAMGAMGSDAAIEAADIVIMNDKLSRVADAIEIARRTKRIVLQNIVFALGVKLVFILLGAFGEATMWEAVFADVGVTILAVINSTRALKT